MKFAPPIQEEISAHLVRLGLEKCPICEAGILGIAEKPVLLHSGAGGWPMASLGGKKHPDSMTDYMVRVQCECAATTCSSTSSVSATATRRCLKSCSPWVYSWVHLSESGVG